MDTVGELSYEEAFAKLERVVSALQDGRLPLERALAYYEEGMKLAQHCQVVLQQAELRVEQLRTTHEGELEVAPFDLL